MKVEKEKIMVQVKCYYVNLQSKAKSDYFVYTDIEVIGHADATDMNHTTGIKVCAGISACCHGIVRLMNSDQYNLEIRKGYFHVWTERTHDLKQSLDKDSVYALNTLVCQLFEIYNDYPNAFTSFDLIDEKENYESYEKERNTNHTKPFRKRRTKGMGIYSIIEGTHFEEN